MIIATMQKSNCFLHNGYLKMIACCGTVLYLQGIIQQLLLVL
jgi:hypothetical protein